MFWMLQYTYRIIPTTAQSLWSQSAISPNHTQGTVGHAVQSDRKHLGDHTHRAVPLRKCKHSQSHLLSGCSASLNLTQHHCCNTPLQRSLPKRGLATALLLCLVGHPLPFINTASTVPPPAPMAVEYCQPDRHTFSVPWPADPSTCTTGLVLDKFLAFCGSNTAVCANHLQSECDNGRVMLKIVSRLQIGHHSPEIWLQFGSATHTLMALIIRPSPPDILEHRLSARIGSWISPFCCALTSHALETGHLIPGRGALDRKTKWNM